MNKPGRGAMLLMFLLLISGFGILGGCGDDEEENPLNIRDFDELFEWSCEIGESCEDVFDIEFAAGTAVDISATEITGNSVVQIALYAPGVELGGINLLTGDTGELLCNPQPTCRDNTDGQSVTGFRIPSAGVYRLAVTRNWGYSCQSSGGYHLIISADQDFSTPRQTVDDEPSQAVVWSCLDGTKYEGVLGWECEQNETCQDAIALGVTGGSVVTFQATDITGGSVVQLALYAPGDTLGGVNLFTGDTSELRCNYVGGPCGDYTEGQMVKNFVIPGDGSYVLAITRDWINSCGGSGTYHLIVSSDQPILGVQQLVDDELSRASGWSCP